MNQILYMKPEMLVALLFFQTMLQEQLIEAQQKIIELQQRIDSMTPKNAPDNEIFWHIASDGTLSEEAAQSDDLDVVRQFKNWNVDFAKRHIKPYVNPQVYNETLNQMTRGLGTRIAELETRKWIEKRSKNNRRVIQLEKQDHDRETEPPNAAVR